jgi:hypothetical protein
MTTTVVELHAIDEVQELLGLQLKQIAQVLGADESTLHRWRSGFVPGGPSKMYLMKLETLHEFVTELRDAFRTPEAARRWVWESRPPILNGERPIDLLLAGKMERVTAVLWAVNNGMPS